jgi:hypothetical protein
MLEVGLLFVLFVVSIVFAFRRMLVESFQGARLRSVKPRS